MTTKKWTVASLRKEVKKLLGDGDYSPLREATEEALPQLRALADQASPEPFRTVAQELGVLGAVATIPALDAVELLLELGVDPNAPNKPQHHIPGRTALQAVTEDIAGLEDAQATPIIEALLAKGASVDAVYPPPDVAVNTPRQTPIDFAIKHRRDAIVELLLPHASDATRVAALVTAVLATEGQKPESDAHGFLARWIERLPADGAGPLGLFALHAAAIVGDAAVWDLVAARASNPSPQLAEATSFVSYSFPAGPKGGVIPSARFAAGSTPLDALRTVRSVFVAGRAKFEAARGDKSWGSFQESQLAKIVARIEALDALEARLTAAGAVSGAVVEPLPGPLGVVEAALLKLAAAAGSEARLRAAIGGIDTTGMGPLGFLLQITSDAKDAFVGLERKGAHRLDLFLTGALREKPILYGPRAKSLRGTIFEPTDDTLLVWPEEYPKEAKRIFETALLGLDGDTVIGATKEAHGTLLWAVTPSEVTCLGEMSAFVREGAAVLLGEQAPEPAAPAATTAASPVAGKNVCITGKMALDRDEVTRKLTALGATVTSSVSGKTEILFAGEKAGSKLAKAQSMGIPILDEKALALILDGKVPAELAPASAAPVTPNTPAPVELPRAPSSTASPVAGKNVCITGKMALDRDEVTRKLTALGATVTSSVSGKTEILFAGEKAGSKLAKAQSMGIPILDEAALALVLDGKAPRELAPGAPVSASAPSAPAPAAPAARPEPPMPAVLTPPRDGAYRALHPGTSQVRVEGTYAAGKKHGTWRWYAETGTLVSEVTFVDGLRDGHETEWHPNGQKSGEGENQRGHRVGAWDFGYESGAFKQRYYYDENGKTHGEYVWNLEDGSPRARGQFWHGSRDGVWVWHAEPNYEKTTRGYDRRGRNHGEEAGWHPGGQIAYRRFFHHGRSIGVHEVWDPSGALTSRVTYDERGVILEKRIYADGVETVERFVRGLTEKIAGDAKKLKRVAEKVKKGKDRWKKQDVLGEAVEYGQRGALLMHLWREGLLDVPKEHELFELVASEAASISGAEVIAFLKDVELPKNTWAPHLPEWPGDLDRLVCQVYARDPEPIDAGWRDLPAAMKRGVGFVLARFGEDVRGEIGDLSEVLAAKHAESAINDRILWPQRTDGAFELEEVLLFQQQEATARFDELLALYGDKDRFARRLLAIAKERAVNPLVGAMWLPTFRLAIERATADDLPALIRAASLDGFTEKNVERALLSWRSDDAETLTKVALAIDDRGLRKWPAVCCAIVKRAEEGLPVEPALVDALELDAGSPSLSWADQRIHRLPSDELKRDPAFVDSVVDFASDAELGPEPSFERVHLLFRALRALPQASVRALLERALESPYGKTTAAPYLHLVDDPALWERALRLYETDESARSHTVALGLAHLPVQALPLLAASLERAPKKDVKASFARAIVGLLARLASRGEGWDPQWDDYVAMELEAQSYDHPYVWPLLRKVVYRLPRERAEEVLLRELDPKGPKSFARAFALIPCHPTEAVMHAAFRRLVIAEDRLGGDEQRLIGEALASLEDREAWIKWLLRSGAGKKLASSFETAVGGKEKYAALERSLETEGLEPAKELDKVDQLAALAKDVLGARGGEPIYLLRRLEQAPADTARLSLNRIGGLPPGVPADEWPTLEDEPMTHLFTLDLATMPELRAMLGGKRTLSLFVANPDHNEAYEPDNDQTAVVMVDDDAAATTHAPPEELSERELGWFEPVRVEVPTSVWLGDGELHKAIYQASARVLGDPIWLQDDQDAGSRFVMQFDESFVDVNLGDMGVMYVYEDSAFWQCH